LPQVTNLEIIAKNNIPGICYSWIQKRAHQGSFTCAILCDYGYLFSLVNTESNVLVKRFNAVGLRDLMY